MTFFRGGNLADWAWGIEITPGTEWQFWVRGGWCLKIVVFSMACLVVAFFKCFWPDIVSLSKKKQTRMYAGNKTKNALMILLFQGAGGGGGGAKWGGH